jgi:hypothetical protein
LISFEEKLKNTPYLRLKTISGLTPGGGQKAGSFECQPRVLIGRPGFADETGSGVFSNINPKDALF